MDIYKFWSAVLSQDADMIRAFFHPDAYINWHNTDEHFNVEDYIRANCEYPGHWAGEVERVMTTDTHTITVTHVFDKESASSFHVTSFIKIVDGYIVAVDEYWGDDGDAPQWRKDMRVGSSLQRRRNDLYVLAMKHIYGDGVPEDNLRALELLSQAHEMGHIEATYNLGICYHYGYGTEADLERAFELYLEAAGRGYGKAMELVGRFYNRGIYVEKNRSLAVQWLQQAIDTEEEDVVEEARKELALEG